MIPTKHAFSIEHTNSPGTEKPFGSKYAGTFEIRRPSLADKRDIAVKKAAAMSHYGYANPEMVSEGQQLFTYIFAFLSTVAVVPLPEWFDPEKLFDEEDELAVYAVWQEVSRWLDTFRRKADSGDGGEGSPQA